MAASLLRNPRFYILCFSALLALGIFILIQLIVPAGSLQSTRLSEVYAFTSLAFLFFALFATPFTKLFPNLSINGLYLKSRRAIGVSAFFFALLHAALSFFTELGGIDGLGFLDNNYLVAVSLGAGSLAILGLLAALSFDAAVRRLTFKIWKRIQRLVYIAAVLALIHAVMIGSHYAQTTSLTSVLTFVAIIALLIPEAIRIDALLAKRMLRQLAIGPVLATLLVIGVAIPLYATTASGSGNVSLSVHSGHTHSTSTEAPLNSTSGAFTASLLTSQPVAAGSPVDLHFQITRNTTGSPVNTIAVVDDRAPEIVVTDDALSTEQYFPLQREDTGLTAQVIFPSDGIYRVYLRYGVDHEGTQSAAYTFGVGANPTFVPPVGLEDRSLTKIVGAYRISLNYSPGQPPAFTYTVADRASGQPIRQLDRLGTGFGSLALVRLSDYRAYLGQTTTKATSSDVSNSATTTLAPYVTEGKVEPGQYRVFATFNINSSTVSVINTIEIK